MKETNIKQIKQINNGSYKLPQYSIGTQILNNMKNLSGEQVTSAASGVLNGVTQIISGSGQMSNAVQPGDTDSFTTTKQNASPYGHYYDTLSLNSNKFLDAAKTKANAGFAQTEMGAIGIGASIGSLFGPIGTGVGAVVGGLTGLFGLGSRNKAIEEAKQYAQDTYAQYTGYNKQNKSVATSMGMRDEYNAEHPNNISYAAEGKQAFDPKWNGTNGIAHEGEFQWDPYTNNGMKITHATNGRIKNNNTTKKYAYGTPGVTNTNYKEDVPVYTQPQHVIFSDIFPEMKYSNGTKNIAEVAEAAQTNIKNGNMPEQNRQILEDLVNEQGMYQKENIHKKYMNQYKCGKMPKYDGGTKKVYNYIPLDDFIYPDPTETFADKIKPQLATLQKGLDATAYRPGYKYDALTKEYSPISLNPFSNPVEPVQKKTNNLKKILPYALPALGNYATNMLQLINQRNNDSKMDTSQRSSYVESPSATTYANIARPIKDNSFIKALRNEAAMQHYANDKSGYGQGLHAAVGNQINLNRMNALTNGYLTRDMNFYNQLNEYGKTLASLQDINAQRRQQASLAQEQMINAKKSSKNNWLRDDLTSWMTSGNNFTQNLINIPTYLRALGRYDSDNGLV